MESGESDETTIGATEVALMLIEHRVALLGYLLSCVRNHADAEDLFQEVSLAATKSAGHLESRDGFLPWAREIARRRFLQGTGIAQIALGNTLFSAGCP